MFSPLETGTIRRLLRDAGGAGKPATCAGVWPRRRPAAPDDRATGQAGPIPRPVGLHSAVVGRDKRLLGFLRRALQGWRAVRRPAPGRAGGSWAWYSLL